MSTYFQDPMRQNAGVAPDDIAQTVDRTLRLIANAPVPEGLEERVQARLRSAPNKGRLLAWPVHLKSEWLRTAAAAAIVAIVAGGGWGVYSRVERPHAAKVIVAPATGAASGGFASAGAIRTPQTLNGPVLKHAPKNLVKKPAKKALAPAAAGQSRQVDSTQKLVPLAPVAAAK